MGVKSTVELSHREAIDLYIEFYIKSKMKKLLKKAREKIDTFTIEDLEDALEELDPSEFNNYLLTGYYLEPKSEVYSDEYFIEIFKK